MFSKKVVLAIAVFSLGIAPFAAAQCDPVERTKLLSSNGAEGDIFGYAAAVSGDTAVIGAHNDDTPAGTNAGSAYVFVHKGGVWQQQAQLFASNGAPNRMFAWSVAVSGDTIVVGSKNFNAAYVFVRGTGMAWTEQARLTPSDGFGGDDFGESVAIDGDTIVVGAHLDDVGGLEDAGSAYVYVRNAGMWTEQARLYNFVAPEYGEFADTVAISGDTVLLSARSDDTPVSQSPGAVHVFVRAGNQWAFQTRLYASDGSLGDAFGSAIAIVQDTAVITAMYDRTAAGIHAGSAYVFVRQGATWLQQTHLLPADSGANDLFGTSVALAGNRILVGDSADNTSAGNDAGSAYLFVREGRGTTWSQRAKLTASDAAANDYFGQAVVLTGETALVGAYADDNARGMNAGSVYVFDVDGDCCPADFDQDGFVTGVDYDQYVAAFEAGDESADFDGDGFITGLDFDAYVVAFEAGC